MYNETLEVQLFIIYIIQEHDFQKIKMNYFKELKVWQKAIELVTETYLVTKGFPKDELFGLVSQIRRCVISIPSNIAEGCGRKTSKDLVTF